MSQQETTFFRIKSDPAYAQRLMSELDLYLKKGFHSDFERAYQDIVNFEAMVSLEYHKGVSESKKLDINSMQLMNSLCIVLLRYFKPKYNGLRAGVNIPDPVRDAYEAW